ncbi:hypothetical protein FMEAI12_2780001 [Parafrankia sp. Ea1.12]|nr:hypothetical protein FMEAI12_2780001 [Parafrankia sp. Ea1.12]
MWNSSSTPTAAIRASLMNTYTRPEGLRRYVLSVSQVAVNRNSSGAVSDGAAPGTEIARAAAAPPSSMFTSAPYLILRGRPRMAVPCRPNPRTATAHAAGAGSGQRPARRPEHASTPGPARLWYPQGTC